MIRKEQQRFSLRKYKVGVASVFLGTTLSFMLANGGAVKASELPTQPSSEEKTELVKNRGGIDRMKRFFVFILPFVFQLCSKFY